jgi:hypothetical protein
LGSRRSLNLRIGISPALAGLNSQEPAKVSTAYAVPVDNYEPSAAVVVAM